MFKKTNRKLKIIPDDLRILLVIEQNKKKEEPQIKYSLSSNEISHHKKNIEYIDLKLTFKECLFNLIDNSNLSDTEVYKNAHIDRRIFSKIKNEENYHPSKNTIISFGLALHLSYKQMEVLLNSAHYSLTQNDYFNITIKYCLDRQIYNIDDVNDILYACKLQLLSQ